MLSSQQPPTQISSHAQLLEIFIEVDQRGDAAVHVDVDVDVSRSLRKAKEESNITAMSVSKYQMSSYMIIYILTICDQIW